MKCLALISLILSFSALGAGPFREWGPDFQLTLGTLFKASYYQFTLPSTWMTLGASIPITAYAFRKDQDFFQKYQNYQKSSADKVIESIAVASTFPILSTALYWYGKNQGNDQLMMFAIEYTAALYLALLESGIISYIPVHRRPDESNLNFWETSFRGGSSFPSGHVIPLATLIFKTFQYYGPWWGLIPVAGTVLLGKERVRNRKHYFSDVIGAVILSAMASEGVRAILNKTSPSWFENINFFANHNSLMIKVAHTF